VAGRLLPVAAGLVLLIADVSLCQEQLMRAFPIDLGMSEGEIVDRLVPEYGQILCDWEREGLPSEDAFERAGAVEEWVETDFGLKGREFLLVSVSGSTGVCAQCFYRRIAVFELHGKEIVFRFEQGGLAPRPSLRVFPLFERDDVLGFAFETGEGSLNMGGYSRSWDEWYVPRVERDGSIAFEKVWSGLIEFRTTDNSSWLSQSACGTMSLERNRGRYQRRIRSFYGTLNSDPPQSWGSRENAETEESCLCFNCGVEIERQQTWDRATPHEGALRLTRETAKRIDRFPVGRFPFDLPARSDKYRRREKPTVVRFGDVNSRQLPPKRSPRAPQHVEIDSPSGALTLVWDYQDPSLNQFRVMTRAGLTKRSFSLPPSIVHSVRQTFLSGIDSLGWQANERRFFAVVRLGPEDRALLSFAVAGTRDYWERPLSALEDPWPFGFVLTPVAASPPK
jgi:hypothetical protein